MKTTRLAMFITAIPCLFQASRCTAQCVAPDAWFVTGGTPAVPRDFKVPDDDECHFYKWGWQSFLWLTQSPDAKDPLPRFVSFLNNNELFKRADGDQVQLIAAPKRGQDKRRMLTLAVRTTGAKGTQDVSAIAFEQATSQGVVIDRNHRSLYYGIHINDAFVDFVRDDLHLTDPEHIKNVDKTAMFPPGCLELKTAWRVLSDEEKKPENIGAVESRFFVTKAQVPTLFTEGGKVKARLDDPPREEMMALVGMHVVGTIVDHPEFIWASFEHVDNSPVLADQALPPLQAVDDAKDYTFYRKGTPRFRSNRNPVTSAADPLTLTDAKRQTLDPIVDIFRQFNSGDNGVGEDEDVKSLNESVAAKLPDSLKLWKNYKMIGAIWMKDPSVSFKEDSHFPDDGVMAGELKLSNSTMETFTQPGKINCFRCHDTSAETVGGKALPGLRIKVSHVIRNAFLPSTP